MSLTRWAGTTAVMCSAAALLRVLTPPLEQLRAAVTDPQGLVDGAGPDALLVVMAAGGAWLCWGWGALGLVLTGLTAVPGGVGRGAGLALRAVLPAGARRLAAVAVGLGLATTGPVVPAPPAAVTVHPAAVTAPALGSPDRWAADDAGVPPDWPGAPAPVPTPAPGSADGPAAGHVVLRGDCLWDIAAGWLTRGQPGAAISDADTVAAVHAWWQANAQVIGPDPDLLLPGQVLRAPPS
jgi:nucleoid-associated protein YgaU